MNDNLTLPFLAHSLGTETIGMGSMTELIDRSAAIDDGYDHFAQRHHPDIDTSLRYEVIPVVAGKMAEARRATGEWPTHAYIRQLTFTVLYEMEFNRD